MRLHRRVRDFVGDETCLLDVVCFSEASVWISERVVVVLFDVVRLVVVN